MSWGFLFWLLVKLSLLLLLPGFFWLYLFAGQKNLFVKTKKSLLPAFFLGVMSCVPALAIEYFCVILTRLIENKVTILISSFFIIAPLEEYLKSLAVDIGGYTPGEKPGVRQIVAWYCAGAIGFASIENVLYFFVFGSKVFTYRILVTTLAHLCCSGIIGYFVGRYKNTEYSGFMRGFIVATLIHGAYDYTLNIYPKSLWVWIPLFFFLGSFLESFMEKEEEREEEEQSAEEAQLAE